MLDESAMIMKEILKKQKNENEKTFIQETKSSAFRREFCTIFILLILIFISLGSNQCIPFEQYQIVKQLINLVKDTSK